MIPRFWWSMMDCGNDGGRVPRPVLPQGVPKPVGNSLSGKTSMLMSATTKYIVRRGQRTEVRAAKGWVCKVVGRNSDWLRSTARPHTKEVWTGKYARSCSKALISYGYKWPPLQSVQKVSRYSLFQEGAMNTAGKEPIEALINLWRLTSIALWIKSIFEEMIIKTAFGLRLSSLWS
jgi:hypothetical protein